MLKYSGGRTPDAGKTIEITRITDITKRTNDDDALSTLYVPIDELKNTSLEDGDIILMREILPIDKEVYIYGQVKRAGRYGFQKSMTLLDLMELAGGIYDESYWKSVYTARAELIRRNEYSDYATTIPSISGGFSWSADKTVSVI